MAVSLGIGVGEGACFVHMGSWEASAIFKLCETLCSTHMAVPAASSWFRGSATPKSLLAAGNTN